MSRRVDGLRALPAPSDLTSTTPRLKGAEQKTFRVKARLVEAVVEDDHDIHLVIAQPGEPKHTMIAEFPDPTCNGAKDSAKKAQMKAARSAFPAACGTIGTSFVTLNGKAVLSGVGFFDEIHRARPEWRPTGSSCTRCSGSREPVDVPEPDAALRERVTSLPRPTSPGGVLSSGPAPADRSGEG